MLSLKLLASFAAFSTCTNLPPGDMKSPQYWGDFMLHKYDAQRAAALANIEAGPPPLAHPRTVLLITGVTIPAEWFDPIVVRLTRDGFNPVVYEPPALLSGDLFDNSQALADVVDQIRAETGEAKIDILAECTGGLIARHYIQSLGGDQYVSRMITFISPQHGLPKAALAAAFAGWPALYDLTPGSDFLDAVNSAPLPADVAVTSIYTCTDEYIQPYQTSIIPGAKNIGLCNKFVGHFQFFYDPEIYKLMHSELVAPLPSSDGDDKADADDAATPAEAAGGCSTTGDNAGLLMLGVMFVGLRRRRR
jgi:triacylglycerol lipase